MPGYDSVSNRKDLTKEEKKAARENRRENRIGWINQDISGKSVQERLERLEAIVLGTVPPPEE